MLNAVNTILSVRSYLSHASILPGSKEVHSGLEGMKLILGKFPPSRCTKSISIIDSLRNVANPRQGDVVALESGLFRRFLMLQALDIFEDEANAFLTSELELDRYGFAKDNEFLDVSLIVCA